MNVSDADKQRRRVVAGQVSTITATMLSALVRDVPDECELEAALMGLAFVSDETILGWFERVVRPNRDSIEKKDDEVFVSLASDPNVGVDISSLFAPIARIWRKLSPRAQEGVWARVRVISRLIDGV